MWSCFLLFLCEASSRVVRGERKKVCLSNYCSGFISSPFNTRTFTCTTDQQKFLPCPPLLEPCLVVYLFNHSRCSPWCHDTTVSSLASILFFCFATTFAIGSGHHFTVNFRNVWQLRKNSSPLFSFFHTFVARVADQ